jgi:DNA processing protein
VPLTPEERDLLALHLVPGIGPRLTAALLERFGSAAGVLRAAPAELFDVPHIGPKLGEQIARALRNPDIEAECRLMDEHGVALRRLGTPDYPAALATIPTPPQLLYVKGTLGGPEERAVALVGSRTCTTYGRRMAERIAFDLAQAGWTVISGLARGIDGCAHRGALQAKGRTVAVLAGGLSRIYPPEHAGLADDITAGGGALVSEAAMRMEPMAGMFPARNRIISGLSRAVVIVEANEKSGALITATHAAEQGREVFAVPGPVDSAASAGTLRLLRDGAKLVRHAGDILEDLQALPPLTEDAPPPAPATKPAGLAGVCEQIWDHLDERRTVDELTRHCQIPAGELARHLMTMELTRQIRRLPGNWYERA